jgi:hypothetical protein
MTTTPDVDTVDEPTAFRMNDVVDALKRLGIPSYVEQTGGGCATIHVGQSWMIDDGGSPRTVFPVCAGAGSFDWHGTEHTADTRDFCIGPDDALDDGSDDPYYWTTESDTVETIIAEIARQYRDAMTTRMASRPEIAAGWAHAQSVGLEEFITDPGGLLEMFYLDRPDSSVSDEEAREVIVAAYLELGVPIPDYITQAI